MNWWDVFMASMRVGGHSDYEIWRLLIIGAGLVSIGVILLFSAMGV